MFGLWLFWLFVVGLVALGIYWVCDSWDEYWDESEIDKNELLAVKAEKDDVHPSRE